MLNRWKLTSRSRHVTNTPFSNKSNKLTYLNSSAKRALILHSPFLDFAIFPYEFSVTFKKTLGSKISISSESAKIENFI